MPIRYLPHTRFARANKKAGGGSLFNDEYDAVYGALLSKPPDEIALAYNAYVQAGLDDGWWADEDWEYIPSSYASGRDANLDFHDPTNDAKLLVPVNAPPWTQYEGYFGDASGTLRLNIPWAPSDGVNFTLNDASITSYTLSRSQDNGGNASDIVMGCLTNIGGAIRAAVLSYDESGNLRINEYGTVVYSGDAPVGMRSLERDNSTQRDVFNNGVADANNPGASITVAPVITLDMFGLAGNFNGSPASQSEGQIAQMSAGKSLGATKQLSKSNAFNTLMVALGKV